MVWLNIPLLGALIIILVKSSDYFVESVARLAKYLGVSEFVIGLTVIAIGTSLPELVSSSIASFQGATELAVGNIVGSNIANIGLVIGVSAFLATLRTNRQIFLRDTLILLTISTLFFIFLLDGFLTFFEGALLLVFVPMYMAYMFKFRPHIREQLYKMKDYLEVTKRFDQMIHLGEPEKVLAKEMKKEVYEDFVGKGFDLEEYRNVRNRISIFKKDLLKDLAIALVSAAMIFISARYMVPLAVELAISFGISETVVGASIIAIGTSLPELFVSFSAVRKGFGSLLLGNMIGSCTFNILLVGGVSAMIRPLVIVPEVLLFSLPFMMFMTFYLFVVVRTKWRITRQEGAALLGLYALFMYLLITGPPNLFIL